MTEPTTADAKAPEATAAEAPPPAAATAGAAAPAGAAASDAAAKDNEDAEGAEALAAVALLSDRLFARMCRGIPLRTFLAELSRLDRALYFRHFKGYRPQSLDTKLLGSVLRKEFSRGNGLLAQLVIYNWDEAQSELYGELQQHVKKINEDVEAIEHITDAEADPIFADLERHHDRRDVAIAALINGVRVSAAYRAGRWGDLLR